MTAEEQRNQSKGDGQPSVPSLDSILERLNGLGGSDGPEQSPEPTIERAWAKSDEIQQAPAAESFPVRESVERPHPEPVELQRIDIEVHKTSVEADARVPDAPETVFPPAIPAETPEFGSPVGTPAKPESSTAARVTSDPAAGGGFSFGAKAQPDADYQQQMWDDVSDGSAAPGALVQLDEYRDPDLASFDFAMPGFDDATVNKASAEGRGDDYDSASNSPEAADASEVDAEVIDIQHRLHKPPASSPPFFETPPSIDPVLPTSPPPVPSHFEWNPLPLPETDRSAQLPLPQTDRSAQLSHIETWSLETDHAVGDAEGVPAFMQPLGDIGSEGLGSSPAPALPKSTRSPIITVGYVLVPIILLILVWWLATRG